MTSPTSGSSPSPDTSPQPVPSPEVEKTAAAMTDSGGTVDAPHLELRQAQITAVDLSAATCSVAIGGDPTSVPNVHYLSNYKPTVNDTCWVLVNGPDILALDRDGKYGSAAFAGLGQTSVAASESTSNGAYGDLVTAGPSVSTTVPASGRLLVCVSANVTSPVASGSATSFMSFAISGATTLAASDTNALAATTYNSAAWSTDTASTSYSHSHSVPGDFHSHSFSGSGSGSDPQGGTVNVSISGSTGSGGGSGGSTGTDFGSSSHSHTLQANYSATQLVASRVVLLLGLTPGAATVTAKYRVSGAGGGNFAARSLWVLPL